MVVEGGLEKTGDGASIYALAFKFAYSWDFGLYKNLLYCSGALSSGRTTIGKFRPIPLQPF